MSNYGSFHKLVRWRIEVLLCHSFMNVWESLSLATSIMAKLSGLHEARVNQDPFCSNCGEKTCVSNRTVIFKTISTLWMCKSWFLLLEGEPNEELSPSLKPLLIFLSFTDVPRILKMPTLESEGIGVGGKWVHYLELYSFLYKARGRFHQWHQCSVVPQYWPLITILGENGIPCTWFGSVFEITSCLSFYPAFSIQTRQVCSS